MKNNTLLVLLSVILALTGAAEARDQTGAYIWNPGVDHGSFTDIQDVVNAILVDSTAQNGLATYTYSGTGDDAMGHVYTSPVGFLSATNGNTFVVLSTGNAGQIPGNPTDSGSVSTDFGGFHDSFRMAIPLQGNDPQLSFDFRFMSEEYPEWVGSAFNDYFHAYICKSGTCTQVSFDGNGNTITINNNFFDGSITPTGTIFDGTTSLLTTTVNLASFDIGPSDVFTLEFEIADVGDNIYDSAVFIDNVRFTSGQTTGTADTSIPEFPSLMLPIMSVLGIMFLFNKTRK